MIKPNRIKQLNNDKNKKKEFHSFLKNFSQIIGVNKEKLIITNWKTKDLYSIIFFLFKYDFILSKTKKEEIITLFRKTKVTWIKKLKWIQGRILIWVNKFK